MALLHINSSQHVRYLIWSFLTPSFIFYKVPHYCNAFSSTCCLQLQSCHLVVPREALQSLWSSPGDCWLSSPGLQPTPLLSHLCGILCSRSIWFLQMNQDPLFFKFFAPLLALLYITSLLLYTCSLAGGGFPSPTTFSLLVPKALSLPEFLWVNHVQNVSSSHHGVSPSFSMQWGASFFGLKFLKANKPLTEATLLRPESSVALLYFELHFVLGHQLLLIKLSIWCWMSFQNLLYALQVS